MLGRIVAPALLFVVISLGVSPHVAAGAGSPAIAAVTSQIPMFDSEAAAQAHCPKDEVVWLNIPSGIYHEKGMRWYGRTKDGTYVCRR
jgi:hypothetical protein